MSKHPYLYVFKLSNFHYQREKAMPYISTIKDRTYAIGIAKPKPDTQTTVTLDGSPYMLDYRQIITLATASRGKSEGGYSLIIAGKSYEIFARCISSPDETEQQTYEIQIAGHYFIVDVCDERTQLLASIAHASAHSGTAKIKAPMSGLVMSALVAPGDTVSAGQTIIILVAMKMENDITSPITGTVKEVKVSTGQTVDQGQLLVIVEGEQTA
jgi:biotin carboxyl carrier protein